MNKLLIITGIVYFIFRYWLTEYQLIEELGFKRFYISRIINLYFAMALVLNFENMIFNIVIFASSPIVLITMLWDVKFYFNCIRGNCSISKRWWQLAERITLHVPILSGGVFFVLGGAANYVNLNEGYFPLVCASLLIFLPFFLLDERWRSKYNWPDGIIILFLIAAAISMTGIFMMNIGKLII